MAITRLAVRQEIGRLTGDMLKVTATANGSPTTFKDVLRLNHGNGSLAGRIGWLASGTAANLGRMVRVTGNSKPDCTVTFADTPLPASTATADVMELWNERGLGYFPDDVNSEINTALAIVANTVTTPDEIEYDDFDVNNPILDIPANWHFFGGALRRDVEGLWHPIPATDSHMDIDVQRRTVRLKGEVARRSDTYAIRLFGDLPSSPLTSDADVTNCDAEWLTSYVAYKLMLGAMRRTAGNDDELATRMAFVNTIQEKHRGRARNRPQGAALRLYS